LLIGIGEEVIITRPTLFGPRPKEITDIVFKSINARLMVHTAEDLCEYALSRLGIESYQYEHADVHHGFILSFQTKPDIDLAVLEEQVGEMIEKDLAVSFADESHIRIGDELHKCTGPRMHVRSTGEIKRFSLLKELLQEPITDRFLLVGVLGEIEDINDLNHLILQV